MPPRTSTYRARLFLLSLCVGALGGCADFNWPYHRSAQSAPVLTGDSAADSAAECANVAAQIKDSQEERREAPTLTTDSDIVNASQGKADKRIDDLRQRYEAMDCPADTAPHLNRQAPLQPAPGGGLP